MPNPIVVAYLGFALLGFTAGCFSKSCTDIGCGYSFTAALTGTTVDFPSGDYRVDVTADGVVRSCTFTFTGSRAAGLSASCDLGLSVFLSFPGPDGVQESIQLLDTYTSPTEIRVQQSRDGVQTFDRTERPTYQTRHPNGSDCEPTCHSASAEWSLGA